MGIGGDSRLWLDSPLWQSDRRKSWWAVPTYFSLNLSGEKFKMKILVQNTIEFWGLGSLLASVPKKGFLPVVVIRVCPAESWKMFQQKGKVCFREGKLSQKFVQWLVKWCKRRSNTAWIFYLCKIHNNFLLLFSIAQIIKVCTALIGLLEGWHCDIENFRALISF